MSAGLALACASLAVWVYLLAGRGGFWRARERDGLFTSPRRGEVGGRRPPGEGVTISDVDQSPDPPHPLPLPSGERVEFAARAEANSAESEVHGPGGDSAEPPAWPAVAAVMPARDEADVIAASLGSLLRQDYPGALRIVVVDDQSRDGTAEAARARAARIGGADRLTVVSGGPLPAGWTGKLWAMQQGVVQVESFPSSEYLLFTDADIAYAPDALCTLVERAQSEHRVLVSLMAKLRCESFAERAFVPAFIFFFQMLYPFAWVNDPQSATAAAAGGCMLVRRDALDAAGGLATIRGALIDDCALGRALKRVGPIWLGLTERARSLRAYPRLADVRRMVARSAYDQLRYSPLLLAATVAGLALTFLAPPLLALFGSGFSRALGFIAWAAMTLAFQPILRFYRMSPLWGLALPAIAAFYLAFTLDSAYQHVRGRGGMWKGRVQADLSETR
jgi:hopene-associated glycosyltransferase HpnB